MERAGFQDEKKVKKMAEETERLRLENRELELKIQSIYENYSTLEGYMKTVYEQSMESVRSTQTLIPKPTQILFKTDESDNSLIVRDGYQWRKYGQKITKDNPFPRAYFKCVRSPICPAKKKVQRCMENKIYLMVTYEGEHNHHKSSSGLMGWRMSDGKIAPPQLNNNRLEQQQQQPNTTLGLSLLGKDVSNESSENTNIVEEYAALLARDPSIKAALTNAVARASVGGGGGGQWKHF